MKLESVKPNQTVCLCDQSTEIMANIDYETSCAGHLMLGGSTSQVYIVKWDTWGPVQYHYHYNSGWCSSGRGPFCSNNKFEFLQFFILTSVFVIKKMSGDS